MATITIWFFFFFFFLIILVLVNFPIFSNFLLATVVKNTLFTFFIRIFGNFGFWPSGENFFQEKKLGIIHNLQEEFWLQVREDSKFFYNVLATSKNLLFKYGSTSEFFPFECGNLGVSFFQKYSLYSLSPWNFCRSLKQCFFRNF